jgi:salicylate hydroxylase
MSPRIAIVGGGLGGLAAALFLRRAGIEATVYEQMAELREVGAGIVVPPNMVRVLVHAGPGRRLPRFAVRLDAAWEFRRWQDGRVLSSQPMGDLRAAVRRALLRGPPGRPAGAAAACAARRAVQLGPRCTGLHHGRRRGAGFTQADGSHARAVTADAAIGADGIHSVVSQASWCSRSRRASPGLCAFRCLVPAADAPAMALATGADAVAGPRTAFRALPDLGRHAGQRGGHRARGRLAQRVVDGRRRIADLHAPSSTGWDPRACTS